MTRTVPRLLLLLALLVPACGDEDPADFAGTWAISVANRDNGCGFQDWDPTGTGTSQLTITQDGESATGTVEGWARLILDLWLGGHTFTGTVDGDAATMTLYGTTSATQGGCLYTINATITAEIAGDTIDGGRIDYRPATNGSPECGVLNDCTTWQEWNGTRPPSP